MAEGSAKEDLGGPTPGQGHEAHAFLEVAVAGQQFESRLDEGLRIQGVRLDCRGGCAGGRRRSGRGFLLVQREIAEALIGTHFSWYLERAKLDGGSGVPGFEGADFG